MTYEFDLFSSLKYTYIWNFPTIDYHDLCSQINFKFLNVFGYDFELNKGNEIFNTFDTYSSICHRIMYICKSLHFVNYATVLIFPWITFYRTGQWKKHGSCTENNPNKYFRDAIELARRYNIKEYDTRFYWGYIRKKMNKQAL